jgi:hypothetical protein
LHDRQRLELERRLGDERCFSRGSTAANFSPTDPVRIVHAARIHVFTGSDPWAAGGQGPPQVDPVLLGRSARSASSCDTGPARAFRAGEPDHVGRMLGEGD